MEKKFEQFLIDKHAAQYQGLDDEMGEDFSEWLQDLSVDEWIEYGDFYAAQRAIEALDKSKEIIKDVCSTAREVRSNG